MTNSKKGFIIIYTISILLFTIAGNHPTKETPGQVLQSSNVPQECPFFISVYRTDTSTISVIPLEAYVKGVVASEMPGSFHEEALKAQAVAARTYAVSKVFASKKYGCSETHPLAPVCDTTHCQVYQDASVTQSKLGWDKICKAVDSTDSQLLYYKGSVAKHILFHASSGGKTENSEDVFVSAVPYLKSVSSPYESDYPRNGHGVGMSQQGANGMASNGYSYCEILSHYYNGTNVY